VPICTRMKRRKETPENGARHAIFLALDDQLGSPDTPEVREHFRGLRQLGHSEGETRELMATILAFYVSHVMRGDDYSYADYVAELAALPVIDWREEQGAE
jgi:hypothetical protein